MNNIYSDGISIEVVPFDLEERGAVRKLDLLYYNSINRYGEVLTTLVYNSGVRLAGDLNSIHYEPNRLFTNTAFERSYVLTETSNVWKNLTLRTGFTKLLRDNSYTADHDFDHFSVSTDIAPQYSNGEYAYDGWYTVVSVALSELPDASTVSAGAFRYNASVGYAQYATQNNPTLSTHWAALSEITPTIPIYDFLYGVRDESFQYTDFMVTSKTLAHYNELLDKKLEGDWFVQVKSLSPKIRTLNTAVENKTFDIAQHIIVSINNSLISILV